MTIPGAMRIRGGFFAILALLCLMVAVIAVGASQGDNGSDAELASSDDLSVGAADEHDHDADGHTHEDGDHADHADGDHADHADGDHADHANGDHGDHADGDHADHADGDHADHADGDHSDHADGGHADHTDDPSHSHPTVPGEPSHNHPPEPPSVYTQVQLDLLEATQAWIYPRFADYRDAEAAGYHSIGDAVTGWEHFVNSGFMNTEESLNPSTVESLVYRVQGGQKTLASGMYILRLGQTLDDVPAAFDTPQTPWHIHTNLCWTVGPGGGFRVGGITNPANPSCPPGTIYFITPPMLHVWLQEPACGWFSDLEQVDTGDCSAHPH